MTASDVFGWSLLVPAIQVSGVFCFRLVFLGNTSADSVWDRSGLASSFCFDSCVEGRGKELQREGLNEKGRGGVGRERAALGRPLGICILIRWIFICVCIGWGFTPPDKHLCEADVLSSCNN